MRISRSIGAALVAVVAVLALSACIRLPFFNTGGGGGGGGADGGNGGSDGGDTGGSVDTSDLIGTTWSGTDSDGDFWSFDFQDDGTLGFTLNDQSYDDGTDVWSDAGGTLTIDIEFDNGHTTMSGPHAAGDTSIDLDGVQGDAVWTVTVTQD